MTLPWLPGNANLSQSIGVPKKFIAPTDTNSRVNNIVWKRVSKKELKRKETEALKKKRKLERTLLNDYWIAKPTQDTEQKKHYEMFDAMVALKNIELAPYLARLMFIEAIYWDDYFVDGGFEEEISKAVSNDESVKKDLLKAVEEYRKYAEWKNIDLDYMIDHINYVVDKDYISSRYADMWRFFDSKLKQEFLDSLSVIGKKQSKYGILFTFNDNEKSCEVIGWEENAIKNLRFWSKSEVLYLISNKLKNLKETMDFDELKSVRLIWEQELEEIETKRLEEEISLYSRTRVLQDFYDTQLTLTDNFELNDELIDIFRKIAISDLELLDLYEDVKAFGSLFKIYFRATEEQKNKLKELEEEFKQQFEENSWFKLQFVFYKK